MSAIKGLLKVLAFFAVVLCITFIGLYFLPNIFSGSADNNETITFMLKNNGEGEIHGVTIDGTANMSLSFITNVKITAYDFNTQNMQLLYGTKRLNAGYIYLSNKGGRDFEFVKTKTWKKTSVAVDYITGNIYAVDALEDKLWVIDEEGNYPAVLNSNKINYTDLLDVAVAPPHGVMALLQSHQLSIGSMDGDWLLVVKNVSSTFTAMALNITSREIFYAFENEIFSRSWVHLEKEPKSSNLSTNISSIISLSVAKDHLYVVAAVDDALYNVAFSCQWQKDQCAKRQIISDGSKPVQSIKVFNTKELNPLKVPNALINSNICRNKCEHLCLLDGLRGPDKLYVCKCQEGWAPAANDPSKCVKL